MSCVGFDSDSSYLDKSVCVLMAALESHDTNRKWTHSEWEREIKILRHTKTETHTDHVDTKT